MRLVDRAAAVEALAALQAARDPVVSVWYDRALDDAIAAINALPAAEGPPWGESELAEAIGRATFPHLSEEHRALALRDPKWDPCIAAKVAISRPIKGEVDYEAAYKHQFYFCTHTPVTDDCEPCRNRSRAIVDAALRREVKP